MGQSQSYIQGENKELEVRNYYDVMKHMEVIQKKQGDPVYGEYKIVEHQLSGQYFAQKSYVMNTEAEYENLKQELLKIPLYQNEFFTKMLDVGKDSQIDLCNKYIKVGAIFEYAKDNLQKKIQYRKQIGVQFREVDIYFLILCVSQAIKSLAYYGIEHGNIKPKTILLGNDGNYKIADTNFMGNNNAYTQYLHGGKASCYLSPQLLWALQQKQSHPQHNPIKSDIFSLGIIGLEAASLVSSNQFYDFRSFQVKQDKVEQILEDIKTSHSQELVKLLRGMLNLDENLRFSIQDIENHLQPYEENLRSLKVSQVKTQINLQSGFKDPLGNSAHPNPYNNYDKAFSSKYQQKLMGAVPQDSSLNYGQQFQFNNSRIVNNGTMTESYQKMKQQNQKQKQKQELQQEYSEGGDFNEKELEEEHFDTQNEVQMHQNGQISQREQQASPHYHLESPDQQQKQQKNVKNYRNNMSSIKDVLNEDQDISGNGEIEQDQLDEEPELNQQQQQEQEYNQQRQPQQNQAYMQFQPQDYDQQYQEEEGNQIVVTHSEKPDFYSNPEKNQVHYHDKNNDQSAQLIPQEQQLYKHDNKNQNNNQQNGHQLQNEKYQKSPNYQNFQNINGNQRAVLEHSYVDADCGDLNEDNSENENQIQFYQQQKYNQYPQENGQLGNQSQKIQKKQSYQQFERDQNQDFKQELPQEKLRNSTDFEVGLSQAQREKQQQKQNQKQDQKQDQDVSAFIDDQEGIPDENISQQQESQQQIQLTEQQLQQQRFLEQNDPELFYQRQKQQLEQQNKSKNDIINNKNDVSHIADISDNNIQAQNIYRNQPFQQSKLQQDQQYKQQLQQQQQIQDQEQEEPIQVQENLQQQKLRHSQDQLEHLQDQSQLQHQNKIRDLNQNYQLVPSQNDISGNYLHRNELTQQSIPQEEFELKPQIQNYQQSVKQQINRQNQNQLLNSQEKLGQQDRISNNQQELQQQQQTLLIPVQQQQNQNDITNLSIAQEGGNFKPGQKKYNQQNLNNGIQDQNQKQKQDEDQQDIKMLIPSQNLLQEKISSIKPVQSNRNDITNISIPQEGINLKPGQISYNQQMQQQIQHQQQLQQNQEQLSPKHDITAYSIPQEGLNYRPEQKNYNQNQQYYNNPILQQNISQDRSLSQKQQQKQQSSSRNDITTYSIPQEGIQQRPQQMQNMNQNQNNKYQDEQDITQYSIAQEGAQFKPNFKKYNNQQQEQQQRQLEEEQLWNQGQQDLSQNQGKSQSGKNDITQYSVPQEGIQMKVRNENTNQYVQNYQDQDISQIYLQQGVSQNQKNDVTQYSIPQEGNNYKPNNQNYKMNQNQNQILKDNQEIQSPKQQDLTQYSIPQEGTNYKPNRQYYNLQNTQEQQILVPQHQIPQQIQQNKSQNNITQNQNDITSMSIPQEGANFKPNKQQYNQQLGQQQQIQSNNYKQDKSQMDITQQSIPMEGTNYRPNKKYYNIQNVQEIQLPQHQVPREMHEENNNNNDITQYSVPQEGNNYQPNNQKYNQQQEQLQQQRQQEQQQYQNQNQNQNQFNKSQNDISQFSIPQEGINFKPNKQNYNQQLEQQQFYQQQHQDKSQNDITQYSIPQEGINFKPNRQKYQQNQQISDQQQILSPKNNDITQYSIPQEGIQYKPNKQKYNERQNFENYNENDNSQYIPDIQQYQQEQQEYIQILSPKKNDTTQLSIPQEGIQYKPNKQNYNKNLEQNLQPQDNLRQQQQQQKQNDVTQVSIPQEGIQFKPNKQNYNQNYEQNQSQDQDNSYYIPDINQQQQQKQNDITHQSIPQEGIQYKPNKQNYNQNYDQNEEINKSQHQLIQQQKQQQQNMKNNDITQYSIPQEGIQYKPNKQNYNQNFDNQDDSQYIPDISQHNIQQNQTRNDITQHSIPQEGIQYKPVKKNYNQNISPLQQQLQQQQQQLQQQSSRSRNDITGYSIPQEGIQLKPGKQQYKVQNQEQEQEQQNESENQNDTSNILPQQLKNDNFVRNNLNNQNNNNNQTNNDITQVSIPQEGIQMRPVKKSYKENLPQNQYGYPPEGPDYSNQNPSQQGKQNNNDDFENLEQELQNQQQQQILSPKNQNDMTNISIPQEGIQYRPNQKKYTQKLNQNQLNQDQNQNQSQNQNQNQDQDQDLSQNQNQNLNEENDVTAVMGDISEDNSNNFQNQPYQQSVNKASIQMPNIQQQQQTLLKPQRINTEEIIIKNNNKTNNDAIDLQRISQRFQEQDQSDPNYIPLPRSLQPQYVTFNTNIQNSQSPNKYESSEVYQNQNQQKLPISHYDLSPYSNLQEGERNSTYRQPQTKQLQQQQGKSEKSQSNSVSQIQVDEFNNQSRDENQHNINELKNTKHTPKLMESKHEEEKLSLQQKQLNQEKNQDQDQAQVKQQYKSRYISPVQSQNNSVRQSVQPFQHQQQEQTPTNSQINNNINNNYKFNQMYDTFGYPNNQVQNLQTQENQSIRSQNQNQKNKDNLNLNFNQNQVQSELQSQNFGQISQSQVQSQIQNQNYDQQNQEQKQKNDEIISSLQNLESRISKVLGQSNQVRETFNSIRNSPEKKQLGVDDSGIIIANDNQQVIQKLKELEDMHTNFIKNNSPQKNRGSWYDQSNQKYY